jgi:predicted DNA-binding protein
MLMASHRLSVRISPELERTIQEHARAIGRHSSEIVREVLEQHFASSRQAQSCYDLARKAKAIGCINNAPPDLSTNPHYFEGFGST